MDARAALDRHWRQRLQFKPGDQVVGTADVSALTFWNSAVREYTSCSLTKRSDKLNAIWGIAKVVGDLLGEDYCDGLWSKSMVDQLAWTVADPQSPVKHDDLGNFPSWSWASVDGTINLSNRLVDPGHLFATNHQGQPIAFEVAKPESGQTVPEYKPLAIRSSLVEVKIVQHRLDGKWALDFQHCLSDSARIVVYPDKVPDINETTLHSAQPSNNGTNQESSRTSKVYYALVLTRMPEVCMPDAPEYQPTDDQYSVNYDEENSGSGLLLSHHTEAGNLAFQREGAFFFQQFTRKDLKTISTTCIRDVRLLKDGVQDGKVNLYLV